MRFHRVGLWPLAVGCGIFLVVSGSSLRGQEAPAAPAPVVAPQPDAGAGGGDLSREVAMLRTEIEQQRREIRLLREEIAALSAMVRANRQVLVGVRTQEMSGEAPAPIAPADGLAAPAEIPVGPMSSANPVAESASVPAGKPPKVRGLHTVEKGENLSNIARRYKVPLKALLQANPGVESKVLKPGVSLLVP